MNSISFCSFHDVKKKISGNTINEVWKKKYNWITTGSLFHFVKIVLNLGPLQYRTILSAEYERIFLCLAQSNF